MPGHPVRASHLEKGVMLWGWGGSVMQPTHGPLMGNRINWKNTDNQSFLLVPFWSLLPEPLAQLEESSG